MIISIISKYSILGGMYYSEKFTHFVEPLVRADQREFLNYFLEETTKLLLSGSKHFKIGSDLMGYRQAKFSWRHKIIRNFYM